MDTQKKEAEKPATSSVQLIEGNAVRLQVALLDKIARKLDNIDNNVATLCEQIEDILKELRDVGRE